jgi:mRNA interferase YafQ
MYHVLKTKQFKKSLLKIQRSGKLTLGVIKDLNNTINLLIADTKLPARFRDHPLIGNYKDYRECHIKSDILLIYIIQEKKLILTLVDIGTHSELF